MKQKYDSNTCGAVKAILWISFEYQDMDWKLKWGTSKQALETLASTVLETRTACDGNDGMKCSQLADEMPRCM